MDKKSVTNALSEARKKAKKRNFSQTVEVIIGLKGLNLKMPEHQIDLYTSYVKPWKSVKICGLVGPEMAEKSKQVFDNTVTSEEFESYKNDKKKVKKLAREYDFFVAQANLMPQVAATFGRYFGPLGKMPNPKAGCVVPPNANLDGVREKLNATTHIHVKNVPQVQKGVGKEDNNDEDIADNVMHIYEQVVHNLPAESQNIKSIFVKLTMGNPVRVE